MNEKTCESCVHHDDVNCLCFHPGAGGAAHDGWDAEDECINVGRPHWYPRDALARAEKAEANYRFMVERAADEKLDGYRELGARAAAAEERAEKAESDLRLALYAAEAAYTERSVAQRQKATAEEQRDRARAFILSRSFALSLGGVLAFDTALADEPPTGGES